MSGPAFEFEKGTTYEEAVTALAEVFRRDRDPSAGSPPESPDPGSVACDEQFAAAARESMASIHALSVRSGFPVTEDEMSDDVLARIVLAWMACHACPHIRRNPVQTQVALLAVHRLVCERCVNTRISTPPENDDRCDWCWSHGHADLRPIRMSYGPTLFMGDACDPCSNSLMASPGDP